MPSYYLNEAVIDLPERPFVDKTIHGLEAKLPDGKTLGVLVHRRPVEGARTLRELVDENIALNTKRLSAFTVQGEEQASVGGLGGVVLRMQWRKEGAALFQLQALVVFEGKLVIFAVSGPLEERAACEETFASILATITWRTD
jgi:hypothetical protein